MATKEESRVPWTQAEEIELCKCWINTSKNSVRGNDQKSHGFCMEVLAYFEREIGEREEAMMSQLQTKIADSLRIKQYFQIQDYALWDVIKNGNSFKPVAETTTNNAGTSTTHIPGPVKWNTHVVVWKNKFDLDTMSIDDLYNNFKIVEQEVRGTTSTNSCSQNMAFVSSPNPNSTNKVPANFRVNLEQIYEDDLDEIDLKWQLALLSMWAKRFFQKNDKKITINGSDTAIYDKSKVKLFNCHKIRHFARECRVPMNQENINRNQETTTRTVNVEDTSSKAMVAIDGYDELRVEFNKYECNLANYKRRLALVEEQLVHYRKNESLLNENIVVLKKDISIKDSEITVRKSMLEKISKEKDDLDIKIVKFENASQSLDKFIGSQVTDNSKKGLGYVSYNNVPPSHTGRFSPPRIDLSHTGLPEFAVPTVQSYGVKPIEVVTQTSSVKISKPVKENNGAPLIEDWESEREDEVESPPEIERKTVKPSVNKVEVVIPKLNNKPAKRPVKYAETYKTQRPRARCKYHQREKMVNGTNHSRVNHSANTVPKAVLTRTSLKHVNFVRPVNPKRSFQKRIAYNHRNIFQKVNTAKGKINTARPNSAVLNAVRANKGKAGHLHKQLKDQGYFDSGCSRHMTENISYLTDFKEFDGGYVAFGGGAKGGKITSKADESHVLLKVPRKNNMYSVDKKKIFPKKDLTCWVLVVKPHFKTLYELFRGRTPALSFMRPFGCHVTILNTLDHLGKFDGKSDEGFFVGYSTNSKTFRVYNTITKKVEENLHIKFLENKPIIAGQSSIETGPSQDYILMPLWNDGSLFDSSLKDSDGDNKQSDDFFGADNDMRSFDGVEVGISNISTTYHVPATLNTRIHKDHSLDNVIGDMKSSVQTRRMTITTDEQGFISAIYEEKSHEDLYNCLFACFLSQEEPKRITNALINLAWVEAMQEELLQFHLQKVWTLVDLPRGGTQLQPPITKIKETLKRRWRFRMENCDTVPTLMVEQAKLKLDLVRKLVDHTDYRSMIGSLMYLASSGPDIMFATCLRYPKDSGFDLTDYLDANHVGCHLDRKVLWMRTQLTDYGFFYDRVPVYCDSKSVIAISCNSVQHTRTKHIDVMYHFIKDHVEKGTIELYFVGLTVIVFVGLGELMGYFRGANLKTLDALPSLLNKVTEALTKSAQVIESVSKKTEDSGVPSAGQDGSHPAEGKRTSNMKGPMTLKVYREDGTDEFIPNFKASDLHLDYLHKTKDELGIDLEKSLSEHDPLNKLNDLAKKKRNNVDDIHDYFRANKRLKLSVQYKDHPAETVLNEPILGIILFKSFHRQDFVTIEDFIDFPN
uniref:Retrotransposon protein, putative, unclassified n=1 Tax=Tanacetum cinerariifolium TaxID=118510 RepID=A0A6L2NV24_TANCI|nr:retrotransposon protein, putative, unclassified [Tanacetum cinerariifolium]